MKRGDENLSNPEATHLTAIFSARASLKVGRYMEDDARVRGRDVGPGQVLCVPTADHEFSAFGTGNDVSSYIDKGTDT